MENIRNIRLHSRLRYSCFSFDHIVSRLPSKHKVNLIIINRFDVTMARTMMNTSPTTLTPPSPDPLGRLYKSRPLPPLPTSELQDTSDLIPPPLFSSRSRSRAHSGPRNTTSSPTPSSRAYSQPYTSSLHSTHSSTSLSSPPISPTSSTKRTFHSPPSSPTPSYHVAVSWNPSPRPSLRRKTAPKKESLRSLRKKQSDDCLQRVYQERTLAYLDGSILAGAGVRLGPLHESWEWEV